MKYIREHLQAKLILVVVMTLFIPIILIGAYSVNVTTNELLKSANEKNLQVVKSQSAAALQYLAEGERDVLYLSQSPATRRYVGSLEGNGDQESQDYLTSQFKLFLSGSPHYMAIRILDNTGREIFGIDNMPNGVATTPQTALNNQAAQLYFIEALRLAGQVYISDISLNTTGKRFDVPYNPVIHFSLALNAEGGGIVGVIVLQGTALPILSPNAVQSANEATFIIDDKGNYLANPDSSKLYGQMLKNGMTFSKDRPHDAALLASQTNATSFTSQDSPNTLQAMVRVAIPNRDSASWMFIYSESLNEVFGQINNARLIILLLAGAALITGIGVAGIITQNIVRPVRQLARAAGVISQGEWSVSVPPVRGHDEIAQLAASFDRMARELEALYGSLEERVIARTDELETVAKVGAAAAAILDLNKLLQTVTDLTHANFNLTGVAIYLMDTAELRLKLAAQTSLTTPQSPMPFDIRIEDTESIVAKAGREGIGTLVSTPLRSEMTIPLRVANHLLGVLDLQSDRPDRFSREELRVMAILSDQIAIAVQNAKLYKEQVLTTQQLEIAQRNAEEASKAKSLFLSNMSHELRTPLNVVIGYTSSMLERPTMYGNVPLPEIYAADIRLIKDNGYHLIGLINDILDLSKIEAGKLELQLANTNLLDIFKGVLATSIGLVKDKPIQLKADYPNDLPLVWADAMRVRQIILNLMSNAIKFTEQGSVTLHAHGAAQQVVISVNDTGVGISDHALSSIFDRFQQGDTETSKRYGGTGLGLDISKQLSRMHGGDLTATSVVGQGSTFSFTLPVAQSTHETAVTPTGDDVLGVRKVFSSNTVVMAGWTIMVVEDEVGLINVLRGHLEASSYTIVSTRDGETAPEMALAILPNTIVLDAYPSKIDAWHVLAALKAAAETRAVPVIICAPQPDHERALGLGAVCVLSKPIPPAVIVSKIRALQHSLQTNRH
jgi:signal transduction histidine kinase/CheY-like chemotaxis protein